MKYKDEVYGEFDLHEPVLIDLIQSPALQRLKKINQGGFRFSASDQQAKRFDHSLGAMCLLRKYGASLEEQIHGLIHDVSHSAFSHTIDYALEDVSSQKRQCYQDKIFPKFVKEQTNIPEIIKKHGLDVDYILDETNFPLQETELPDICADRIDYVLRDGVGYAQEDPERVQRLMKKLITQDNKWVFTDLQGACDFAEYFEMMNRVFYSGLPTAVMFKVVGEGLKYLVEKDLITLDDLYTDDEVVENKMREIAKQDKEFAKHWNKMHRQKEVKHDPEDYEHDVWVKSRAVDPLFITKDGLKKLSEAEPSWKQVVKHELKPKQYFLRYKE